MLSKSRQRGYTLIEVVISMSIFGTFVVIAFSLLAEMRMWEKRLPVNFMRHPQIINVIERMRRDVQDIETKAGQPIYIDKFEGYEMGPKTLIFQTGLETGVQTVIWDFSEPTVARRISYNVGVKTEWIARGIPSEFSADVVMDSVKFDGRPYGVRLRTKDDDGRVSIDQILQPRAYE
jgi:prepilin-type N-terminal cleavage/methylation domain-containing protein